MAKDCGFSRLIKEGEGGPGVGALAPVDVWRGQDVHIDVAGRGRKKLPQGIAVPPSVHKACGFAINKGRPRKKCGPGEHRHGDFPCHPEKRKHRGGAKAPDIERPYRPSRTIDREIKQVYSQLRREDDQNKRDEFRDKLDELRDERKAAVLWERTPQGREFVRREKVRRAQAAGAKEFDYYAARVDGLNAKITEGLEYHAAIRKLISGGIGDEELKQVREERQRAKAARLGKAFSTVIQKVLDNSWFVPGFSFKGDVWPPIGDPEGRAGGAGPRAGSSAMAPSNVDVRYTGSPPKGVRWQKLPRQGGESVGGAGAGAVEAAVEEPCEECYN